MSTTATRPRRRNPRRRPTRPPVRVRVTIPAPGSTRKELELLRDTLRMVLAERMNGAEVEHRGSGTSARVVIELAYSGVALNAGPLTALAWALETIDQCVPDDSPLGDVIADLGVRVTTEAVR